METKYSLTWGYEVYDRLAGSHARATEPLGRIFPKMRYSAVQLLIKGDERWPIFRDFIRYIDNWLLTVSPEDRTTTRVLGFIPLAIGQITRYRRIPAQSLLTAFGITLILGEQSISIAADHPSRRVGEASDPRLDEVDPISHEGEALDARQQVFQFG